MVDEIIDNLTVNLLSKLMGNVGIGISDPDLKLTVHGYNILTDPNAKYNSHFPFTDDCTYITGKKIFFRGGEPVGWKPCLEVDSATGNVGIGISDPDLKLTVHGYNILTDPNAKYNSHFPFTDDCTYITGKKIFFRGGEPEGWKPCLEVDSATGNLDVYGDIRLSGADCAEEFEVIQTEMAEPGTVLVIGDESKLHPCKEPYDKKVAGVISGADGFKPGIILGRNPSHTRQKKILPIALAGKVYCKVDANYSPIGVGDLLTTSPTLGHAMRAEDPIKAFGAVIGKALGSLEDGKREIPILVSLQ